MAEKQEQLEIQAKLDTSKLKQDARSGMNAVAQEEKKVEEQSKKTSQAIDDIGKAGKNVAQTLQQAGNAGTQALKQVGQEADKTAKKIGDIDKSVKNLKLGQAISIASRFAGSDIGQRFGNSMGNALGMSDTDKGLAGGAIQGGLQGAAMGAMVAGPWGAAAGALLGAGTALLQAGDKLKEAAELDAQETEKRLGQTLAGWYRIQGKEKFDDLIKNGSDVQLAEKLDYERKQKQQNEIAISNLHARIEKNRDDYGLPLSTEKKAQLEKGITEAIENRANALQNIARLEAEIARRSNLPVGPEIPEYLRIQRDAEADAFVGPEIPEWLKAQRDAEADAFVGPEMPFYVKAQREAEEKAKSELDVERIKGTESLLSLVGREGQTKLTDSLTRIGGGAGYGGQMQSISTRVVDISKTLKDILNTLKNPQPTEESVGVF